MAQTQTPLNICFLCDEYPPAPHGGNGSLYSDLAEGLVAAGHRVTVVGIYENDELAALKNPDPKKSNLRVVRLKQSPDFLRYRLRTHRERHRLLSWLKKEQARDPFDVIEGPDYGGWIPSGGPAGAATIVRMGGSNLFFDTELKRAGDPLEHRLEKLSVARATHLAAVSRYCAERTLQFCGVSGRPCEVIYNAVDTNFFAPAPGVETERGLIVFVNSINPKKGIEQLVDSMNFVCPKFPEARLVVIGQDTQKKENGQTYVERLQQRVRPEFRQQVLFTGRLDRRTGVLDYLRRAHVCCYPSHMETFGIAPVEAMSIGRPTVYSRTGPGPEVIEDGVSGLLCDPHSATDIADKILKILSNPALAETLGNNARQRVKLLFDKSTWIQRNLSFFQSCVRSRP